MNEFTVKIKALTPIWTGDAERQCSVLKETGIIGSLRWWYEALIRGLGGYACDPTHTRCDGENHCDACELFGCTGWARKFRFEIVNTSGNLKINEREGNKEILFKFIPLRKIEDQEWTLLNLTLKIIAEYGALGGKTVFKPTEENSRQDKLYHKDFGLIKIISSDLDEFSFTKEELKAYVKKEKWRKLEHGNFKWVSIQNFWCVNGKYLCRKNHNSSSFNKVLGRKEAKNEASQLRNPKDEVSKWLAGYQKESKKVFSFKNPPRTFGFINPSLINFDQMKKRLVEVWGDENTWSFLKGDEIIDKILEEVK